MRHQTSVPQPIIVYKLESPLRHHLGILQTGGTLIMFLLDYSSLDADANTSQPTTLKSISV